MCKLCLSKFFFIKTPFDTFKTPKGLQGQRPSRLCAPCPVALPLCRCKCVKRQRYITHFQCKNGIKNGIIIIISRRNKVQMSYDAIVLRHVFLYLPCVLRIRIPYWYEWNNGLIKTGFLHTISKYMHHVQL